MGKNLRTSSVALLIAALGCDDDRAVLAPEIPCLGALPLPSSPIEALASAYQNRDIQGLTNLLPTADEAEYRGFAGWGREVELRVHQRMFDPEDTPITDVPIPQDLWITDFSINLTPVTELEERTDLYQPEGSLDPTRWRAMAAEYHAVLFVGTQGETDYVVDGRTRFVVIEDLTKASCETRKFLIYLWQDLGDFNSAVAAGPQTVSWTDLKSLYL